MNPFEWHYIAQERVWLVWGVVALVGLLVWLELRSRGALAAFLSPVMQRRLTAQATLGRTLVKLGLVLASLVCAVAALMRPQARGETETVSASQAAADVMFVLDTSRSMLAEDAAPNRLERAKLAIDQLAGKLENHRVGLVAFAGRAVLMCPLTPDHGFFSTTLATVDTRSAGRGGSKLGVAIKTAVEGFPKEQGAKLMVLITDGDDQDEYTQEAAKKARDAGIKIIAVGLGSETGSEITLTDPVTKAKTTLMHDGKPVISKLDGKALLEIAKTTEGAYIPAGTAAVDLDSIVKSLVTPIVRAASDSAVREIPAERYPWFVMASLALLLVALWVGAGTGDRRAP